MKYEIEEYLNKNTLVIGLACIILTAALLTIPQALREQKLMGPAGENVYADIQLIEQIQKEGIKTKYIDHFSADNKLLVVTPYHYIISLLGKNLGMLGMKNTLIIRVLQPLLGILTTLVFFLLLKKLGCNNTEATITTLLLILSPIFIHTFTYLGPDSLAIFLLIIGAYLFLNNNPLIKIMSAPILGLILFFNSIYGIIILALATIYCLQNKYPKDQHTKKETTTTYIILAVVLLCTAISMQTFVQPKIYDYQPITEKNAIQELISEVGGKLGFSMFALILAIAGIATNWRKKKAAPYYVFLFMLIIYAIFINPNINPYLNLGITYLAAIGIIYINKMEWQVDIIKSLTITLTICGLLFTTIMQINITIKDQPNKETMDAIQRLAAMKKPDGREVVLTYYSNSQWVKSAGKTAILDYDSLKDENNRKIYEDITILFNTRHIKEMNLLIKKYEIKYVWIDSEMMHGKVWNKEDDGLLFLIQKSKLFTKAYQNKDITIWEYKEYNEAGA